jgi:hypothetical protein
MRSRYPITLTRGTTDLVRARSCHRRAGHRTSLSAHTVGRTQFTCAVIKMHPMWTRIEPMPATSRVPDEGARRTGTARR